MVDIIARVLNPNVLFGNPFNTTAFVTEPIINAINDAKTTLGTNPNIIPNAAAPISFPGTIGNN